MKTVLVALVITTFASTLPAAAAETTLVLRRGDTIGAPSTGGKVAKASAAASEAPPAKKIRVVLASPYGN